MVFGYCRVSTMDKQDITRQVLDLRKRGVDEDNIYLEHASGTKRDRIELDRLLRRVTEGDIIVATEVSRITRSTKHLIEIVELAKKRHLKLMLGNMIVDCTKEKIDSFTNAMLMICGVFSELERDIISERVRSGLINAKSKGKILGRRKTTIDDIPAKFFKLYELYKRNSISKRSMSRVLEISYPTILKYINLIENNHKIE